MPSREFDYDAVCDSIRRILNQPGYDNYDEDVKHTAGPVLVRLAWHAAGTYDKETDTGGSDGAGMRYEAEGGDPANAGLQHARVFLEPVKKEHPWITYADLWTLAGVVAVKEMGGPQVHWKPGRTDFMDDSKCPPRGRLPDASLAHDHLRQVFYRMGFNDREIVALSGAHNLGKCHTDRSGYEGPWVNNPTRFSNQYFKLLKKLEWKPKKWGGPLQFVNSDFGEELMMLPTDRALVSDPSFSQWVDKYAEDRDLFFSDFADAFSKLLELGVKRDQHSYKPAGKKSDQPGAPGSSAQDAEAEPVRRGNIATGKTKL
ncbi:heme-binding peroxidase [Puccinia graminis f. sp. tritici CRL 75-36-700-3]|uniref:Peroxidase n=1 Tax=Puccinia graminis f. sp. tritici (strain CRL 75-36-700-3 / race SCCL) TaxID=418459 RepID=E3K1Q1_PUCGT|nr:heme-binding peroxidase [Puccinia graminis f. sp. tritici CRL 75-36-700-3]EFP78226.1 heme-binding peroxidase [Puccinia graminis f. sp. tritici CRL 75-36-700-3]